jgi:hypothetical protein
VIARLCAIGVFVLIATIARGQEYFHAPSVNGPDLDQFAIDWYSKNLRALHEPSLWELSETDHAAEAYRFLWLRANHNPGSVRIVNRAGGGARLFVKAANGEAGYECFKRRVRAIRASRSI